MQLRFIVIAPFAGPVHDNDEGILFRRVIVQGVLDAVAERVVALQQFFLLEAGKRLAKARGDGKGQEEGGERPDHGR